MVSPCRSLADTKTDEYQAEFSSKRFGFPATHHAAAEQTHGNGVAVVRAPVRESPAARRCR